MAGKCQVWEYPALPIRIRFGSTDAMADEIRSVSSTFCKEAPAGRTARSNAERPVAMTTAPTAFSAVVHKPSVKGLQLTISCWGAMTCGRPSIAWVTLGTASARRARVINTRSDTATVLLGTGAIRHLRSNPPANPAANEFTCLQVSEPDSGGRLRHAHQEDQAVASVASKPQVWRRRYDRARAMPYRFSFNHRFFRSSPALRAASATLFPAAWRSPSRYAFSKRATASARAWWTGCIARSGAM